MGSSDFAKDWLINFQNPMKSSSPYISSCVTVILPGVAFLVYSIPLSVGCQSSGNILCTYQYNVMDDNYIVCWFMSVIFYVQQYFYIFFVHYQHYQFMYICIHFIYQYIDLIW